MNNRLKSRLYHERKALHLVGTQYTFARLRGVMYRGKLTLRTRDLRKFFRAAQIHSREWMQFLRGHGQVVKTIVNAAQTGRQQGDR